MGLKWDYNASRLHADFQARAKRIDDAILLNLTYLGEQCVNIARTLNTYRDQTGNLRNSVGYLIVKDGVEVKSNFVNTVTGGSIGTGHGRRRALERAADFPSGYALIVVAGMNYAATVESTGKDVLTSAEQFAKTELPRMLRELKIDVANLR